MWTLGSESAVLFLSDADVQRDTQLCVVHPTIAVKVSNMIAMRFFLSRRAILFNFSYAKILQSSAMKVYFHIAECSKSYAKIMQSSQIAKH